MFWWLGRRHWQTLMHHRLPRRHRWGEQQLTTTAEASQGGRPIGIVVVVVAMESVMEVVVVIAALVVVAAVAGCPVVELVAAAVLPALQPLAFASFVLWTCDVSSVVVSPSRLQPPPHLAVLQVQQHW